MKRVNLLAVGILAMGTTFAGGALAGQITLSGNNVDFTFNQSLLGLFGTPTISGNTLTFTPHDFYAEAFNAPRIDLTNQTMHIRVSARPGFEIANVSLLERGDYFLEGQASSVSVAGQLRLFDLNNHLTSFTDSIVSSAPLTIVGLPTRDWTANAGFTFDTNLYELRNVNVTVENLLIARALGGPDSVAFIEKKEVFLNVTPVPEPETWAMMLGGLGLVGWMTARRRSRV